MEKIKSFKDLKIWLKGMEIVKDVYSLTKKFPREELFGLTIQVKRAAISIPSNIAEGFRRFHKKEQKQFMYIVLGSAAELETQLIIANELLFIEKVKLNEILEKLDHLSRMVSVLITKFV